MEKKRGLGRGLDALLGGGYSTSESADVLSGEQAIRGGIFEININKIEANPTQPRDKFDQEKLDELTKSIKSMGIIQPITLRRVDRHKYQIISGERRFKAAKAAGLEFIAAYIREANDNQVFEMALVENIQREDLNPIEIALSYQKLIDEFNLTIDDLAERVSKKRTTLINYLRLLKLPDTIQFAVKQKAISMGHARALINLQEDSDKEKIVDEILAKGLSVRQVEEMVRSLNKKNITKSKAVNILPERYKNWEAQLKEKYKNNISIKRNAKGKGHITLHFTSDESLEVFLNKLK